MTLVSISPSHRYYYKSCIYQHHNFIKLQITMSTSQIFQQIIDITTPAKNYSWNWIYSRKLLRLLIPLNLFIRPLVSSENIEIPWDLRIPGTILQNLKLTINTLIVKKTLKTNSTKVPWTTGGLFGFQVKRSQNVVF